MIHSEINITPCICNSDNIAYCVAYKGCYYSPLDSVKLDEGYIKYKVKSRSDKAGPERIFSMLRSCINTAEKLVKAHKQNAHNESGSVVESLSVFRMYAQIQQNG